MKIAMFGHKRIPSRAGGVETVVEELSTRMAARGHWVTCYNRGGRPRGVLPGEESLRNHRGVRLKTVPTLDKKGLAAVTSSFFAAVWASFSDARVVHIHAEGPAAMCWLPKLLGKRVVVTIHGLDWQREKWKGSFGSRYIRMGERMAAAFADEIIVLSAHAQQYFRDTYHRETVRIPNGVSLPQLLPAREITKHYGLEKKSYLLFLGRLVPEKGVHMLLEAFRGVKTEKKLVIAGAPSDSEDYVLRLRKQAQGDERVLFTGFVCGQLLEELYSNAYLYVLPSGVEGMPLSLLEAMSYGNCCLVSDIPECAETAGDSAVLAQAGNAAHWRARLQWLCDHPEEAAAYGKAAREAIRTRDSWDAVTEKTLELYQ